GLWGSGETNWRVSRLPKNVAGLSTAGGLRVTWQVRAPEDVTVPAGRFTAWRIDYEVFQTGAGGRQTPVWQFSTWYAPAVRQLVKADDDGTGWLSFEVASIEATPPAMATGPTPPPPPATTPPVATPAPSPVVKTANRWAVIIGVGTYASPAIPRLRYATRDAEAMYRFLTTKGGYPKDNVLLLTDGAGQKPTLQNIRRALGEFLYRKPGREDMVLIYYAGHGAPEVDTAGNETDGLAKYLIPMDAEPESLYSTAL